MPAGGAGRVRPLVARGDRAGHGDRAHRSRRYGFFKAAICFEMVRDERRPGNLGSPAGGMMRYRALAGLAGESTAVIHDSRFNEHAIRTTVLPIPTWILFDKPRHSPLQATYQS